MEGYNFSGRVWTIVEKGAMSRTVATDWMVCGRLSGQRQLRGRDSREKMSVRTLVRTTYGRGWTTFRYRLGHTNIRMGEPGGTT